MYFKRFIAFAIAITSIAVITLAIFAKVSDKEIGIPFLYSGPYSSLTGLKGSDGPVLVVKLDDTTFAHPQVGLRSADVVYIEQVEGGLTRLAAVFASSIPSFVGPVRSARISDIELLAQYGKIAFAYSGAQKKLLPEIASANLFDVGANKYGPNFYANDPARIAPYAMMVKAPELLAAAAQRGVTPAVSTKMGWKFGDAPTGLSPITSAHISWPASSYDVQWSPEEERWLLRHNGNPNSDETGYILGPKTFVVQFVSITDSIYKDKVGGVTPFSATVGEGNCYILRNGGYLPCKWNRLDQASGTTFTDLSGNETSFEKGQIWFALTAKEPVFTAKSLQDATKSASK
ncbi:Protein of unknown function DUF3048, C-terminal domain containing protein [Candidatus Nanopelagicaceae bacterium]